MPHKPPVALSDREARLARESGRELSRFARRDLRMRIVGRKGPDIELPAVAVRLLVQLLTQIAQGHPVSIVPVQSELTTQQAAEMLGVSRPFLVKVLDEKRIPCRKVGTHRRVMLVDLLRYKQGIDARRHELLDKLAEQGQEFGLGY